MFLRQLSFGPFFALFFSTSLLSVQLLGAPVYLRIRIYRVTCQGAYILEHVVCFVSLVCVYLCVCTYQLMPPYGPDVRPSMRIHKYTYIYAYTYLCERLPSCMYIYMYVCVYIYICVFLYIYMDLHLHRWMSHRSMMYVVFLSSFIHWWYHLCYTHECRGEIVIGMGWGRQMQTTMYIYIRDGKNTV